MTSLSAQLNPQMSPRRSSAHALTEYVLIADGDLQRAASCRHAIRELNVDVLQARDCDEALAILQRLGPPVLFVVEVSLPGGRSLELIDQLRRVDRKQCEVIAWSRPGEATEAAAEHLRALEVRPVHGPIVDLLRAAAERTVNALPRGTSPGDAHRESGEAIVPPVPEAAERQRRPSVLDLDDGRRALARELARLRRDAGRLSLILLDIDRTVAVQAPRNAPPDSDAAASAGEILAAAVRGGDLAIRWNATQFMVVLRGSDTADARQIAERVRAAVHAGMRYRNAVSAGVAQCMAGETIESAVARATANVDSARMRGKNRVG